MIHLTEKLPRRIDMEPEVGHDILEIAVVVGRVYLVE